MPEIDFLHLSYVAMFCAFMVGHALCDLPLQGSFLSNAKRRGAVPAYPWWIALPQHGIIHGGAVWLVTGELEYGILEFVCHTVIDYFKCEGKISTLADQTLHVLCKVAYIALISIRTQI